MAAFGSWFSSIATKLIDVIEEEKNAMIHEQQRTCDEAEALDVSSLAPAVPPWHSLPPDAIKMIKLLNKSKLNFTKDPPASANFEFDYDKMLPSAMASLEADEELKGVRFYLVPRFVTEPRFWRNWFYRVSLIKEAFLERGREQQQQQQPDHANAAAAAATTTNITNVPSNAASPSTNTLPPSYSTTATTTSSSSSSLSITDIHGLHAAGSSEPHDYDDDDLEEKLAKEAALIEIDSNIDDDLLVDEGDEEWRRELSLELDAIPKVPSSTGAAVEPSLVDKVGTAEWEAELRAELSEFSDLGAKPEHES